MVRKRPVTYPREISTFVLQRWFVNTIESLAATVESRAESLIVPPDAAPNSVEKKAPNNLEIHSST
jgi:hypothetical protein